MFAIRNKCIASSNKCLTSSNKKLLGTSASLLGAKGLTSIIIVSVNAIFKATVAHMKCALKTCMILGQAVRAFLVCNFGSCLCLLENHGVVLLVSTEAASQSS